MFIVYNNPEVHKEEKDQHVTEKRYKDSKERRERKRNIRNTEVA
jgi:hypothetical protein